MSISFSCACGKSFRVAETAACKRGKCPQCGQVVVVPTPALVADEFSIPLAVETIALPRGVAPVVPPVAPPPLPVMAAKASVSRVRNRLYLLLVLVFLPLGWMTFAHPSSSKSDFVNQITTSIQHHPESADKVDALSEDATKVELCAAFPDDRLDGALLPERTWAHWGFALASAAVFLAAVIVLFPAGHANWYQLAGIGVLTGTLGILLLLAFQWVAFHMPLFRGHGIITILLDIVWLIGQSYRMALGDYGFILSFLGFTAGVGFCEEACKALPLIVRGRAVGFSSWRSALLWGLVSGIGFGVSEGITYSTDYYNGIAGIDMYLVRFVSCVGLHGIWAAAVGISVFRRQDFLRGQLHPLEWIWRTLQIVIVPMVLHGLYDTLLKQNHDAWALAVAVASFGWLAYQIESSIKRHDTEDGSGPRSAALAAV